MDLTDKVKRVFEKTSPSANRIAAACGGYSDSELKKVLEHCASLTSRAATTVEMANYLLLFSEVTKALEKMLDTVKRTVETGKSLGGDVTAFCEIVDAVRILNSLVEAGSGINNQEAVEAFQKLFAGLSRFCRKSVWLEPYGQLFVEIGRIKLSDQTLNLNTSSSSRETGRIIQKILHNPDSS